MLMQISIQKMKVYAFHGVLPQENLVGANYYVTLEADVEVDDSAAYGDQLEGTVNYALLCHLVQEEMAIPSKLLEHVVKRMADKILAKFPTINHVFIHLEKENPPLGICCQGVGIKIAQAR